MHRHALAGIVIVAIGSASHAGNPPVSSTFDIDDEGWSTDLDARDFRWEPAGGNPGGYIAAVDIGSGQYWRFAAPGGYLGDLTGYYGRTLSYDMIQLGLVGNVTDRDDVQIRSGNTTLAYRFGYAPSSEWTAFSVRIAEGEGWTIDGVPATEQQILGVLAGVDSLSIRGEYRVGADSAGLDNVRLGAGCTADFNGDSDVNFFDVADYIDAFNAGDADADLAEPFGELNFFDIAAFIAAFNNGC